MLLLCLIPFVQHGIGTVGKWPNLDLSYQNLVEPQDNPKLPWADLREENLVKANLKFSNLMGADFSRANLSMADLEGADLKGVIMIDTKLFGTNLEGANLENAYLENAKMKNANLIGANLIDNSEERPNSPNRCFHAGIQLKQILEVFSLEHFKVASMRN